MAPFLTVKEASQLTGKSSSSIRRIIYPIIHDDAHPDRSHVQPMVEEVMALRMKGENFAWRLSEELLLREFPTETRSEQVPDSPPGKATSAGQAELVSILRRELDIKNGQIQQQGELIAKHVELIGGLSERLREGNILIGTLQQRLALPDGRDTHRHEDAMTKPVHSIPPKKGSSMTTKPAKPKRGFLSRLFH
jgi:hypothetical protein